MVKPGKCPFFKEDCNLYNLCGYFVMDYEEWKKLDKKKLSEPCNVDIEKIHSMQYSKMVENITNWMRDNNL